MRGIVITNLAAEQKTDVRGETMELFKGLPGRQVTFYRSRAGASFANHFHKGLDPSKDPEYFFLIIGRVEFRAENGLAGETMRQEVGPEELIIIQKNIYHEFIALEEVVFIEYRSTIFNPETADCFPHSEYQEYLKSL